MSEREHAAAACPAPAIRNRRRRPAAAAPPSRLNQIERVLRLDQHDPRRLHEQNAQIAIAPFRYLTKDCAVAGRDLFGNEPQPAATRPLENASPVPMAATMALEMIGPMPGTLISRSHPDPAAQERRCRWISAELCSCLTYPGDCRNGSMERDGGAPCTGSSGSTRTGYLSPRPFGLDRCFR